MPYGFNFVFYVRFFLTKKDIFSVYLNIQQSKICLINIFILFYFELFLFFVLFVCLFGFFGLKQTKQNKY